MVQRRIGLKGVAAAAGVSVGTVSHVLNHPERVSAARRAAVEQAIADLDSCATSRPAGCGQATQTSGSSCWTPGTRPSPPWPWGSRLPRRVTLFISNSARDLTRAPICASSPSTASPAPSWCRMTPNPKGCTKSGRAGAGRDPRPHRCARRRRERGRRRPARRGLAASHLLDLSYPPRVRRRHHGRRPRSRPTGRIR